MWLIYPDHSNFVLSSLSLFHSLSYYWYGHWSSTFISFKSFFLCIHSQLGRLYGSGGWLGLCFDVPSSQSVITISSFWFTVRDVQLFFYSNKCLEAIIGLLICLISVLLCLRPKERERVWSGQNTQHLLSLSFYVGAVCGVQNNYNGDFKGHYQVTITNNNEKNLKC